ncbi:calcium-binding protein [Glaciecola siphonariae]|uniref:Calcium-binding protein n=1 Tax=Glaciecola siphonariae TaxID=521012 RepID=A0ABV9LRN3_9ALTE
MRTYKKIMIMGMSVIVAQAVIATSQAEAQEGLFNSLDKNQDGLISQREAAGNTKILENFTRVDINEDGFLSMDELTSSPFLTD